METLQAIRVDMADSLVKYDDEIKSFTSRIAWGSWRMSW